MKKLKEYLKTIFEGASLFFATSFIVGFLIWNFYLQSLGFEINEFIQTKFIFSGSIFLLLLIIIFISIWIFIEVVKFIWLLIRIIFKKINKILLNFKYYKKLFPSVFNIIKKKFLNNQNDNKVVKKEILSPILILLLSIINLLVLSHLYAISLFPIIPGMWGGGAPRAISFVANINFIQYLNTFGVETGLGSQRQTANLCVAYEDNSTVVFLLKDRVMEISKENLIGFNSLPGYTKFFLDQNCRGLVQSWIGI